MFTGDSGVASIALVGVIEEDRHSLGQLLMVAGVRDEVFLGGTNTFAAEQGAGGETAEYLDNGIIREAGHCVPLIGGLLYFIYNEITEEENNPTKIQ